MPYTDYPVWKFSPNWGKGVLERLEWKTDVLVSEVAEEQRIPRRLTPRRYIEASFLVQGRARKALESFLSGVGVNEFVIPLWHDVAQLTAALPAGSEEVPFDTMWREYQVGGLFILRNPRTLNWEVGGISSIADDQLLIGAPTETDWPAGTYVHPARRARIVEQTSALKVTDNAAEYTIRFELSEPTPQESNWYTTNDYRGTPILSSRPDESEDLTKTYQRLFEVFDTGMNTAFQRDSAGKDLNSVAYRWGLHGREKLYELRRILHYVRGKNKAFWLPSFTDDLKLISNVGMFDTTIQVQNTGYTARGVLASGTRDFQMVLNDGFVIHRRIIAATEIDEDTEEFTLDAPFFTDVDTDDVREFMFLYSRRLDQDTVELSHPTDIDGTTHCTVSMKIAQAGSYWVTSKLYPISPLDSLDAMSILQPEGRLLAPYVFPFEPLDLAVDFAPTGTLRNTLLLYPYWPLEAIDATVTLSLEGTLRALLLLYPHWPFEAVDAVCTLEPSGTLRALLLHYGYWPYEAMNVSFGLEPTGTLS